MPAAVDKLRKAPGIVRLHGHRGARGIWPENTLLGFKNTFDTGVDIVELDILLTKDDIPVVTHNPRLMAETTRSFDGEWLTAEGPKISDLTYTELSAYDVGGARPESEYGQRYPEQAFLYGQAIPSLQNVADLSLQPQHKNVWLNIEIKSTPTQQNLTPDPKKLASKVIEVVELNRLSGRVMIQSFDWRVLEHVAQIAPHILRSHLTYLDAPNPKMAPNIYPDSPWMAGAKSGPDHADLCVVIAEMGGHIWSPFHEDVVAEQVAQAQQLGLIVNAWTVNAIADIDRMIDAGVDGIITDYPARVQKRLIERGLNWREEHAMGVR